MTIKQMYYALVAANVIDTMLGAALWVLLFMALGII